VRRRRSALIFGCYSIFVFSLAVRGQTPQPSQAAAPPDLTATIRSATRLVQVSVVVQDKKGNFVTDLKKEDFTVFDEGKPQDIAFSQAPSAVTASSHSLLPANVFTNRLDLKGQQPGVVTIVLFDSLNTSLPDQTYVRKQVLEFLKVLNPQDHVAIYALTTQLLVLHEFNQDASVLVDAVNHFTPKELAAYDSSHPAYFDFPGALAERVNQANAKVADQNKLNRRSRCWHPWSQELGVGDGRISPASDVGDYHSGAADGLVGAARR
jgi:VWFA-related protein